MSQITEISLFFHHKEPSCCFCNHTSLSLHHWCPSLYPWNESSVLHLYSVIILRMLHRIMWYVNCDWVIFFTQLAFLGGLKHLFYSIFIYSVVVCITLSSFLVVSLGYLYNHHPWVSTFYYWKLLPGGPVPSPVLNVTVLSNRYSFCFNNQIWFRKLMRTRMIYCIYPHYHSFHYSVFLPNASSFLLLSFPLFKKKDFL